MEESITTSTLGPSLHESASYRFSKTQKRIIITLFVILFSAFIINWHATFVVLITLLTGIYFSDLIFNFYLIFRSYNNDVSVHISDEELAGLHSETLPTYTILCPLYKETEVVKQFIQAMKRLDYPEEKLHVLLLLEEDDTGTRTYIQSQILPRPFSTLIIPNSFPKTKPKALNIGLSAFPDTDYCVIYDAEDIPDEAQLKKAVVAFRKLDKKTICLQAKLDFYNPHQNKLTRVFTAEYSMWFNLILIGLQSIGAPIPLGGTSNHFRTNALRELRGWDPFNVTEDCDLGMRLFKQGYKTAILDSTTFEEANSDVKNWIAQRTRWIKGYIQTYLVHMRDPRLFMSEWKKPHLFTFQLTIGGKILSMFINPLMWTITISYFILRPFIGDFIQTLYPPVVLYLAVASLIFGNFLYLYYYMIGCVRRGYDGLLRYTFLIPLYWLGISYAAFIASYQIVKRPYYWSKTRHGLHLKTATV